MIKHILLLQSALLITACDHGNPLADIQEFMQQVDNKPLPDIAPLPKFESYQSFTYSATQQRSPFSVSITLLSETANQWRNAEVKPPEVHTKQLLEKFPLSSLRMVGTLKREDTAWALVEDAQGGIHRVGVGDYIGQHWGKVDYIADASIDVTEVISDGTDGWLLKSRTLEFEGLQK